MSSNTDSDISSFAEWEAQNPAQSFSEREQSLLDMKDPARVWGDRDSSNDARSSVEMRKISLIVLGRTDQTGFICTEISYVTAPNTNEGSKQKYDGK